MTSPCAFCGLALEAAPSRACASCGERLHHRCFEQLEARRIAGCGHGSSIQGCLYLDDARALSLDAEGELRLWDLATGRDRRLQGVPQGPTHLLASEDRARLFVLVNGALRPIDAEKGDLGEPYTLPSGYHEAVLSSDGERLLLANNHSLSCMEVRTFSTSAVGSPLKEYPQRLALSHDGFRLAALYAQTHLLARDVDTGETLFDRDLSEFGSYFDRLLFSPNGEDLLLEGSGVLLCLEGLTGSLRWREQHGHGTIHLRCNQDGSYTLLQCASHNDVAVDRLLRGSSPSRSLLRGPTSTPLRFSFLGDDKLLLGFDDGTLLSARLGGEQRILDGHRAHVHVEPTLEARALWRREEVYGGDQCAVVTAGLVLPDLASQGPALLDLELGQRLRSFARGEVPTPLRRLTLEDGTVRLLGCWGTALRLLDEEFHTLWSTELDSYADLGTPLLAPDGKGGTLLLAPSAWTPVVHALDLETGALRWKVQRQGATVLPRVNLTRLPDGTLRWLLQQTTQPGLECVQLSVDGEEKPDGVLDCTLPLSVSNAALTPDGAHLLLASISLPPRHQPGIGLWNIPRREFLGVVTAPHRNWLRALAVSPAGTLLATSSGARLVHLWSLPSGRRVSTLGPLPRAADQLLFNATGDVLLTLSEENQLCAWDLTGLCPRTDALAAFAPARRTPEGLRRAERALAAARAEPTVDALAALLLLGNRDLAGARAIDLETVPGPLREALRKDFDARVVSAAG